ncbi:putative signal transducing protein [Flavilitoribacter nigricans]|uniref:DUF2007 domain-containing protein n=1 Tax=Flavilitoribacter nigricans (strain ATCC 23147 / DSM 23189 / NBRC 102662 / NCIMB 1420 / SS-2) TaxID=1122177 RepID=A0A2D0NFZ7_FLAN2|nr:DUF2007 domain-containing protein [Flavilitoribacter nigricans]PHN07310.1 hypothetical protein CRP01_06680 [Flavilitoribacter nigricans DSM 23189 = NBRC 102662]
MGNPLDYFGEFEEGIQVVAVRYFSFASEASLYAAHLRDAGIRCFVSNTNSVTMLPLEQPGIGLHIRSEDWQAANEILREIDQQLAEAPAESYHDADEDEIEYLRSVQEGAKGNNALMWLVVLIIGLLVFRTFARAAGLAPVFWDWF